MSRPASASLFRPSVQPYLISWLRHDPAKLFAELKAPALLVEGTTDVQIPAADGARLAAANPAARHLKLANMNHVLKLAATTDQLVQLPTYLDAARPLHPRLVDETAAFLRHALCAE